MASTNLQHRLQAEETLATLTLERLITDPLQTLPIRIVSHIQGERPGSQ